MLLYDHTKDQADFRFGDAIAAIDDVGDGTNVVFESGNSEKFDLVIIAEGVGSQTREMVFPDENKPRWLDMSIAYFTFPRTDDDYKLWRWYHTTGGRGVSFRPDQHGTTRAMLSVQRATEGEYEWSTQRQKEWLRSEFADAGWETQRVLTGMDETGDFYFDALRQVKMEKWSKGNVVLTGDAAWCVPPMGGVGATRAVVGAYILAGELSRADDTTQASAAYDERLRSYVEKAQDIPKIAPRLANPQSSRARSSSWYAEVG